MPAMDMDTIPPDPQAPETDASAEVTEAELRADEASESSVDAVDLLLDEVERALMALDDGTYGTCAECGQPIDDAVLTERPTVSTCGACTLVDAG